MDPHQERKPDETQKTERNFQLPQAQSEASGPANPPKSEFYTNRHGATIAEVPSNLGSTLAAPLSREKKINGEYPRTRRVLFQAEIAERKRKASAERNGVAGIEKEE